jgi:hypothetical protein
MNGMYDAKMPLTSHPIGWRIVGASSAGDADSGEASSRCFCSGLAPFWQLTLRPLYSTIA